MQGRQQGRQGRPGSGEAAFGGRRKPGWRGGGRWLRGRRDARAEGRRGVLGAQGPRAPLPLAFLLSPAAHPSCLAPLSPPSAPSPPTGAAGGQWRRTPAPPGRALLRARRRHARLLLHAGERPAGREEGRRQRRQGQLQSCAPRTLRARDVVMWRQLTLSHGSTATAEPSSPQPPPPTRAPLPPLRPAARGGVALCGRGLFLRGAGAARAHRGQPQARRCHGPALAAGARPAHTATCRSRSRLELP
jgi:hypothetical protein